MRVQVQHHHVGRPCVRAGRVLELAQHHRQLVAPHGNAERRADPARHHHHSQHPRQPPRVECGELPQQRPRRQRQPHRRQVQRPLRHQHPRRIQQVRHWKQRQPDPSQAERLEFATPAPRQHQQPHPHRQAQQAEQEAPIQGRRHERSLRRRVVHPELEREHEQAGEVRERRHRRQPNRPRRRADEDRRAVHEGRLVAQHHPAHDDVRGADGYPARRVDRHAAARWPLQTHHPGPRDQRGDNGSVLFAEKPSREGGGGPADAVARERGVHGEHGERRGHQLGPAYEVRDGFDVHRMHGEDEPSGERAAIARPAAGDERHRDARPGVPQHVRRVKPRRPSHAPVECVCREGQRTVHPAAQLRRPVWLEKRAPHTAPAEHQRVEVHDGIVVEREAVPQGARVHRRRAGGDNERQAPSAHASSQTPAVGPASDAPA